MTKLRRTGPYETDQLEPGDDVQHEGEVWEVYAVYDNGLYTDDGEKLYEVKLRQVPGSHDCLSERFESVEASESDLWTVVSYG